MKKFLFAIIGIGIILSFSCVKAFDDECVWIESGLNVFSTPSILKSISFENGGDNISFATMEGGLWKPVVVSNDNVSSVIRPLNGYIIRNRNKESVCMRLEYNKNIDNPSDILHSKTLDAGWNFLGVTKENKPFEVIANTLVTSIIDFTKGSFYNKVLGFGNAITYGLTKAYGVFVNSSDGIYGGTNGYDNYEMGVGRLENQINENIVLEKGKRNEKTIFSGYFTAEDNNVELYKLGIFCVNEAGPCFSQNDNVKFSIIIGENTYIIKDGLYPISIDNIIVKKGESIPIKVNIDAYVDYSDIGTLEYIFRLNPERYGYAEDVFFPLIYITSENGSIYNNRLVYAHERANENGIISESNIDDANLYSEVTNEELAVLMNKFSDRILNNTLDTSKDCEFVDNLGGDIVKSCQLGLIEENDSIDFSSSANIATFGTMLSRALRGSKYDNDNPYYSRHLKFLLREQILEDEDVADLEEGITKGKILDRLRQTDFDLDTCDLATTQCLENPNFCRANCKINHILKNNLNEPVTFSTTETDIKVVFSGTYTALERDEIINGFYIGGDYLDDGDFIHFYVSVDGEEFNPIELNDLRNNVSTRDQDKNIMISKGETVNVIVEAAFHGTHSDKTYDYNIRLFDKLESIDGKWVRFPVDLAPIRIVDSNNTTDCNNSAAVLACQDPSQNAWDDCPIMCRPDSRVYMTSQNSPFDMTTYTVGIDKADDSYNIYNIGLYTSNNCYGESLNPQRPISEGGTLYNNGDEITVANQNGEQIIRSIGYLLHDGNDYSIKCISKDDYPAYFDIDGEPLKVFAIGIDGSQAL